MRIFAILYRYPDGESNSIHTDEEGLLKEWEKTLESCGEDECAVLAEVESGSDFGFGARGDFFGGNILASKNYE